MDGATHLQQAADAAGYTRAALARNGSCDLRAGESAPCCERRRYPAARARKKKGRPRGPALFELRRACRSTEIRNRMGGGALRSAARLLETSCERKDSAAAARAPEPQGQHRPATSAGTPHCQPPPVIDFDALPGRSHTTMAGCADHPDLVALDLARTV